MTEGKYSVIRSLGLERGGKVFLLIHMKIKYSAWCLVSAAVLGGTSCKEKPKSVGSPEEDKSVVETVVESVKEAVTGEKSSSLSVEERAAKTGFAKYLPKDAEMVLTVYNAEQAGEQLKALELYDIIERNAGMGGVEADGIDQMPDDEEILEEEQGPDGDAVVEEEMPAQPSPWTLLGREVTIGLGKTAAEHTGHLLTLSRRMGYFQAKALGRAAQAYAKTGSMEDFSATIAQDMQGEGLAKSLLGDPESGTALLDKAVMPPLYLAFRAKEGELEQAAQMLNSGMAFFGMAGEMAVPAEFETGGAKFSGYKLVGEKIAETMEAERENMEQSLPPETVDALLSALRKKNLYFVTGTVGEYVVMMIAGSEEAMTLVTDAKDSLVASGELDFVDAFADKQMLSLSYGGKESLDTLIEEAGGLTTYALGIRDGIAGGEGLGDTRDLEEMLQLIADREKALMALGSSNDFGMVAYSEDGLKVESFGGYDKGAMDWDAKTTLSHLGDSGDNLLFLNVASNAAYDEKLGEYVEAIVETAYAATVKFSSLEIEAPELAEMKQMMQLFDGQFREDAVGLYGALSGSLSDGLGHESAVVIDLKGSVPAVPGIPQEVVDEGKAPRITFLAPVKDRSKLGAAWEEMNTRTTSLLAKVSEMTGEKIPMQKPISSEKDGMTTWFFSFPFFQDDFMPSVTVSDKWFAASTSKTQAQDLIGKAEAGGETGQGVEFYVNFIALTQYADEMLKMADKNSAVIFKSEFELGDFNDNKAQTAQVIAACKEFDSLKWTSRVESGVMRNSVHFKTK